LRTRGQRRIRPMNFTDVLDESFDLYRSSFWLFVGIAAVLYAPQVFLQYFSQNPSAMGTPQIIGTILSAVWIVLIASPLVTAALTLAISERYLDRPTSVGECYRRVFSASVFFRVFFGGLLVGLCVLGAMIPGGALIGGAVALGVASGVSNVPMFVGAIVLGMVGLAAMSFPVYVFARLLLVIPIIVLENQGISASMTRAWELIRGNILKGLGLMVLVSIAVSIAQSMVVMPLTVVSTFYMMSETGAPHVLMVANALLTAAASAVLSPFSSIVTILVYYDSRMRREGFDLELLARNLRDGAHIPAYESYAALPQERVEPDLPQRYSEPESPELDPGSDGKLNPPSERGQ